MGNCRVRFPPLYRGVKKMLALLCAGGIKNMLVELAGLLKREVEPVLFGGSRFCYPASGIRNKPAGHRSQRVELALFFFLVACNAFCICICARITLRSDEGAAHHYLQICHEILGRCERG